MLAPPLHLCRLLVILSSDFQPFAPYGRFTLHPPSRSLPSLHTGTLTHSLTALLLWAPPHRLATRTPCSTLPALRGPRSTLRPSRYASPAASASHLRCLGCPSCNSLFTRHGTSLPPPHSAAAHAAHSGPPSCHIASLGHRLQPPTYRWVSLKRAPLTQDLGALLQQSSRLESPLHARSASHRHGPLPLPLNAPLRPGRPSGQPQSRTAWCSRLSHVPSDRVSPNGTPVSDGLDRFALI